MVKKQLLINTIGGVVVLASSSIAYSATPLWTFLPLKPTSFQLTPSAERTVTYQITNQSPKRHTLALTPITGVTQVTTGVGTCSSPFTLNYHESCLLKLRVQGRAMKGSIIGGPVVCEAGSKLQCYQPTQANSLQVTLLSNKYHTVGGNLIGLKGTIVLQNNGTDNLSQSIDGSFEFSKPLISGSPYAVSVLSKPASQICSVSNGYGVLANTNITDVRVNCSAAPGYTLRAQAQGLANGQSVEVENTQNKDTLTLSTNTATPFATKLAVGTSYNVVVTRNPTNQTCTADALTNTGVITTNPTDVLINCDFNSYPVGGTVSGLLTGTLTLQINGGDTLVISKNGKYTFSQQIANHTNYKVTVVKQPVGQVCTLTNTIGQVNNAPVTKVNASCHAVETTLSASVTELALSTTGINEYGVANTPASGKVRRIVFTNTGTATALNLTTQLPTDLPNGTNVTTNTCLGINLAPGDTCYIEVTPGATASYSAGKTPCTTSAAAPNPSKVTVSAINAVDVSSNVVVLGYNCQYKHGYLFAVDDTPAATASIKGKVAYIYSTVHAAWWSGPARTDTILGIDETSTPASPSPTTPSYPAGYPAPLNCNGPLDGKCNSSNITTYYNKVGLPLGIYPAGICLSTEVGTEEWYSPAICELNYGFTASTQTMCGTQGAPTIQNMSNLTVPFTGDRAYYWSSTEYSVNPQTQAWRGTFIPNDPGKISVQTKNGPPPLDIVCAKRF